MGLQLPKRVRHLGMAAGVAVTLLVLSGCSTDTGDEWRRAAMPLGASDRSDSVTSFWQWTWVAALLTGVLVWGLIIFAVVKYRRRSDDEIPVQVRYNLPLEILYTVAPVVMVLVFFKFVMDTAHDVNATVESPDHEITVVGQQWSWTFNYVKEDAIGGQSVYQPGTPAEIPTLYLPVGETVHFTLRSPDVIHSFWVPAFTYKLDVIPGRDNEFTMTPTREGTYAGRCSELCGTYHSRMLFNVKIVSRERFTQELQRLQAEGNVGTALGGSEAFTEAGLNPQKVEDN